MCLCCGDDMNPRGGVEGSSSIAIPQVRCFTTAVCSVKAASECGWELILWSNQRDSERLEAMYANKLLPRIIADDMEVSGDSVRGRCGALRQCACAPFEHDSHHLPPFPPLQQRYIAYRHLRRGDGEWSDAEIEGGYSRRILHLSALLGKDLALPLHDDRGGDNRRKWGTLPRLAGNVVLVEGVNVDRSAAESGRQVGHVVIALPPMPSLSLVDLESAEQDSAGDTLSTLAELIYCEQPRTD